jgi:hypothetical protein
MGRQKPYIIPVGIAILCFICLPVFVWAQAAYLETFGQNRIQHRVFNMRYFDTKHFRIYHYDQAGRQLGRFVAEEAERDIAAIEKKIGGQFPKRFNIILYNSFEDYKQTNIGLKEESQIEENSPGNTVDLVGDKLVVYFTGVHTDLRHQIRIGMAKVVMERMIFGDSFRQILKNSLLLNLPPWVTEGYISYVVDGWDTKTNSKWKSLLEANPNKGFFELSDQYPEVAGKAFWKFVSEQYGEHAVKNLLYTMQEKSSLNKGMKEPQTLHMKVRKAYDSCIAFYKATYMHDALVQESPDSANGIVEIKVPHDDITTVRNFKVSPKGADVAYVELRNGEYRVNIKSTQGAQSVRTILEGGRLDFNDIVDPDYPLMCWSNNGLKLGILYKQNNQLRLRIYNSLKARVENYLIPGNRFDRALGMTFLEEDDDLIFSAIKKAQTDLYEFRIKGSKMTNITNDLWDDIQPVYVSGGTHHGILFLSNRPKPSMDVTPEVNQLPAGPMNMFFYDTKTRRRELLQCSNITSGIITQPIQYGAENFAFLYDSNGVQNKYVVIFGRDRRNHDSAYAVPITNYKQNIINHQYSAESQTVSDVVQIGERYKVYTHPIEIPGVNVQPKKLLPTTLSIEKPEPQITHRNLSYNDIKRSRRHREDNDSDRNKPPIISGGTAFQTEFTDTATARPRHRRSAQPLAVEAQPDAEDSSRLTLINDSTYLKLKPANYRLSFSPDFFTVRLDNSILFNQYQILQDNGGQYTNPSLSGLVTVSLNDVMENYRFTGGFQLPINLSGTAYFLQFENFRRRLDWGLLYLRTQNSYTYNVTYTDTNSRQSLTEQQPGKTVTNLLQFNVTDPLDHIRSIRFRTALRYDQISLSPVDPISISSQIPNRDKYWSMSRIEYVFDNTTNPAINIRNGFRYKFYAEYLYGINSNNLSCYNLGLDFRYYKKIYKNFIWATRLAYAHSDGTAEVEYSLGGVDNWINSTYDKTAAGSGRNYYFQSLATNLRGYGENARNGNNFAVLNTEFRLPVLATFLRRPVQSAILKNLQVVVFADAGSAWSGFLPNADNTSTSYFFSNQNATSGTPPIVPISVQGPLPGSGGLAFGFGGGLRTTILGYFLRADVASNKDGGKAIFYFSLGTDF